MRCVLDPLSPSLSLSFSLYTSSSEQVVRLTEGTAFSTRQRLLPAWALLNIRCCVVHCSVTRNIIALNKFDQVSADKVLHWWRYFPCDQVCYHTWSENSTVENQHYIGQCSNVLQLKCTVSVRCPLALLCKARAARPPPTAHAASNYIGFESIQISMLAVAAH